MLPLQVHVHWKLESRGASAVGLTHSMAGLSIPCGSFATDYCLFVCFPLFDLGERDSDHRKLSFQVILHSLITGLEFLAAEPWLTQRKRAQL